MAIGSEQPLPPSPQPSPSYTYPPVIILLTVLLLIFLFIGFFSVYFCRCFMQNILCTWPLRRSRAATPLGGAAACGGGGNGLDPSIVKSFPSFTYSTVKGYRKERYGLECAICLLEFKDSDVLRLLTICSHVFHQECIDLWLESHNTCPVCRRNLASPVHSPVKSPVHENVTIERSVSITIKNENEDEQRTTEKGQGVSCNDHKESDDDDDAENKVEKFSRSHSTGHSIRRNMDNQEDRFTLRLPEHVKSRIIRGHNSSKSLSKFGEYTAKEATNSGLAEVAGASGGDDNV